jgi:hypothetical protein
VSVFDRKGALELGPEGDVEGFVFQNDCENVFDFVIYGATIVRGVA